MSMGTGTRWGSFDVVAAYVDLYQVDSDSHWLGLVCRMLHFSQSPRIEYVAI